MANSNAEEQHGSSAYEAMPVKQDHPSQALFNNGSQISLINSKTMTISRPVLENHPGQFHNGERNIGTRHSRQGNVNSNPTTKGRLDSHQSKRNNSKELLASPMQNNSSIGGSPQNDKLKKSGGKQLKKDASIGRVSAKIGLKLKKQPPPLPRSFEQSPLFDQNLTSQYFRIQPEQVTPYESQQQLYSMTMKMAKES